MEREKKSKVWSLQQLGLAQLKAWSGGLVSQDWFCEVLREPSSLEGTMVSIMRGQVLLSPPASAPIME